MAANVILFKKSNSIVSKCIAYVTGSDITHSAVLYDGELYDASELRGKFGKAKKSKLLEREVEVYKIGASENQVQTWIIANDGRKYDYAGILQWILFWLFGKHFEKNRIAKKSRLYCFEATAKLLSKVSGLRYPANISGENLKRTLGVKVYHGKLSGFLNVD